MRICSRTWRKPSGQSTSNENLRVAGAARYRHRGAERRGAEVMLDQTIAELAPIIGNRAARAPLGRPRAIYDGRHRQARHPATVKPELVATGPNDVWSWDITTLLGPEKWIYFHLYVIIDIYSRYVLGWLLAKRETAELAKHFIAETINKHNAVA